MPVEILLHPPGNNVGLREKVPQIDRISVWKLYYYATATSPINA